MTFALRVGDPFGGVANVARTTRDFSCPPLTDLAIVTITFIPLLLHSGLSRRDMPRSHLVARHCGGASPIGHRFPTPRLRSAGNCHLRIRNPRLREMSALRAASFSSHGSSRRVA